MSDPVTNSEIEDVLSSIRRLVTKDQNRSAGGTAAVEDDGKFVLTPAHRVVEPPENMADSTGQRDAEEGAGAESLTTGEAVSALQDGAGTPPGEPWAEPSSPEGGAEEAAGAFDETLEKRIAELEAAINQAAGEWEPDGSESMEGDDAAQPLFRRPAASGEVRQSLEDDGGATQLRDEEQSVARFFRPHAMDAGAEDDGGPAELELQGEDTSAATPAADGGDAEAGDVQVGGDPSEAHLRGDEVSDDAQEAEGEAASWFEAAGEAQREGGIDEAAVLDEEALRGLVAELVREELQGVLGERITRNIRRLVRREIQRALSLRDAGH